MRERHDGTETEDVNRIVAAVLVTVEVFNRSEWIRLKQWGKPRQNTAQPHGTAYPPIAAAWSAHHRSCSRSITEEEEEEQRQKEGGTAGVSRARSPAGYRKLMDWSIVDGSMILSRDKRERHGRKVELSYIGAHESVRRSNYSGKTME